MDVLHLLAVARGEEPADLRLANAQLVNVLSGEIHRTDVVVADGRVAALGPGYQAREVVDLDGRYVCPGLIDAHVHLESAMVLPGEYARAVVPRGVTAAIADPHEIANVLGLDGIRFLVAAAAGAPLSVHVNAPSCVPASRLETSGASLDVEELERLRQDPSVLGLGEVMDQAGVVRGEERVIAKLRAFRGRRIDGHGSGLSGHRLDAYVAAGISSDHECRAVEEAREKLRRGLTLFLREGSAARNLSALLPLVTAETERRLCFCTDDRAPGDLLEEGSIDHLVRRAIAAGVDPITAIRMATLNPADHYALHEYGAVAPGRRADLMVFSDLLAPRAERVFHDGVLVARDGALLDPPRPAEVPPAFRETVRVDTRRLDFRVPQAGREIRVIGVVSGQLVTEGLRRAARIEAGQAVADPDRDLLKLAVVERHGGSGRTGLGFVAGMGLRSGALASTVAHDHHNLVVVGADDGSMRRAARAVIEAGGGQAVADGDQLLALVPLPIAGLMSEQPIERIRDQRDSLLAAARALGSSLPDPFMTLSFLALEVVPALKLTDVGLVDAERGCVVPLFVSESPR